MEPDDWVRLEVETALARELRVIPILVEEAKLPSREQLPDTLWPLLRRNAIVVESGRDFHVHVNRLIDDLNQLLAAHPSSERTEQARRMAVTAPNAGLPHRAEGHDAEMNGQSRSPSEFVDPPLGGKRRGKLWRTIVVIAIIAGLSVSILIMTKFPPTSPPPDEFEVVEEIVPPDPIATEAQSTTDTGWFGSRPTVETTGSQSSEADEPDDEGAVVEAAVSPPPPPPPVAQCNPGPYIVFFDWGESSLTPEAAAILSNATTGYANCGTAAVMLAGYMGASEEPASLSRSRAESVRRYLVGRGIPARRFSIQESGEAKPLVGFADGIRELQNRRVEVTFGPGSGR
jgi:outer membrane protein OmpA-like peptidoglycan-associated protein